MGTIKGESAKRAPVRFAETRTSNNIRRSPTEKESCKPTPPSRVALANPGGRKGLAIRAV